MLFPVRAFLGLCIGGIIPVLYAYINKNTDDDRKSGVMGIASSFTLLGNLVGPLLCTLLVIKVEIRYIFFITGLMLLGNAVLIFYNVKEKSSKPPEEVIFKSEISGKSNL